MISARNLALFALGLGAATTALAQSTADKVECVAGPNCPPLIPNVPTARPFACIVPGQASFNGDSDPTGGGLITLEQCALLTAPGPAFDFEPASSENLAGLGVCYRDDVVTITATSPCATEGAILIYFFDGPTPSLLPRRKEETRRRLEIARDTSVCPSGLTACRVEDTDNGFECLDTTSELESCGGCRFGLFEEPTVVDELTAFYEKSKLLRAAKLGKTFVKARRNTRSLTVAAEVTVGLDCSDRSLFGENMTCKQGACVPLV